MSRITRLIDDIHETAGTLTSAGGLRYAVVEAEALEEILAAVENSLDGHLAAAGLDPARLDQLAVPQDARHALLALAVTGMPAEGIQRIVTHYAQGRPICLENETPGAPVVRGFIRTTRSEGNL